MLCTLKNHHAQGHTAQNFIGGMSEKDLKFAVEVCVRSSTWADCGVVEEAWSIITLL